MSDSIIREKPVPFGSNRQSNKISELYWTYAKTFLLIIYLDNNSPLKLFTHAKLTISEIFKNIASYVHDSNVYICGMFIIIIRIEYVIFIYLHLDVVKSDRKFITHDQYKETQQLKEKVSRILSVISRDHMKVVFFGRLVI